MLLVAYLLLTARVLSIREPQNWNSSFLQIRHLVGGDQCKTQRLSRQFHRIFSILCLFTFSASETVRHPIGHSIKKVTVRHWWRYLLETPYSMPQSRQMFDHYGDWTSPVLSRTWRVSCSIICSGWYCHEFVVYKSTRPNHSSHRWSSPVFLVPTDVRCQPGAPLVRF